MSEPKKSTREIVVNKISDLVTDFLSYDRKEDEDLPLGEIERLVEEDPVLIDEMCDLFRAELLEGLGYEEGDDPDEGDEEEDEAFEDACAALRRHAQAAEDATDFIQQAINDPASLLR